MLQRVREFGIWHHPTFRQVLLGTCDNTSPLQLVRGNRDILATIFNYVLDLYGSHILKPDQMGTVGFHSMTKAPSCYYGGRKNLFPPPTGININMMPFITGDRSSLPKEYHTYWHIVRNCDIEYEQLDKVSYLTIHESMVPPGQSQRRAGLHVEAPGNLVQSGIAIPYERGFALNWGAGMHRRGGIYMVSNVANSTRIWNVLLQRHEDEIANHHGGIEFMREMLGEGDELEANELVWFTDRTPHESLSIESESGVYRQFFRLVTSEVSLWYEQHSTRNPLGIEPGPEVRIIKTNKFENV